MCSHPVGYSGSLSTVNETCNKTKDTVQKYCRCTSFKSPRTLNSGVHLFASLEKTTCHHCSMRSLMSQPTSRVSPYLFAAQSTGSDSLDFQSWCSPGCQMHLDQVTWQLVHSPHQHLPASRLRKFSSSFLTRTCHEFSTTVRWLSHVDIAWLVGLRHGSLRTCLSSLSHSFDAGVLNLQYLALMMSEV